MAIVISYVNDLRNETSNTRPTLYWTDAGAPALTTYDIEFSYRSDFLFIWRSYTDVLPTRTGDSMEVSLATIDPDYLGPDYYPFDDDTAPLPDGTYYWRVSRNLAFSWVSSSFLEDWRVIEGDRFRLAVEIIQPTPGILGNANIFFRNPPHLGSMIASSAQGLGRATHGWGNFTATPPVRSIAGRIGTRSIL